MNDSEKQQALERYIHFFNRLDTELDNIQHCMNVDVRFHDPFNDIAGRDEVAALLRHFASTVRQPRFAVSRCAWDGNTCFIRWEFSGHLAVVGDWRFPGVSELHFNEVGEVCQHIDYWDAAEHFYARLPLIGRLIAAIRRRVSRH